VAYWPLKALAINFSQPSGLSWVTRLIVGFTILAGSKSQRDSLENWTVPSFKVTQGHRKSRGSRNGPSCPCELLFFFDKVLHDVDDVRMRGCIGSVEQQLSKSKNIHDTAAMLTGSRFRDVWPS